MNGNREDGAKGCQYALVSEGDRRTIVSCNSPLNPQVGSCPQPVGTPARAGVCLGSSCYQCQYSRSAPPTAKRNAFQRR